MSWVTGVCRYNGNKELRLEQLYSKLFDLEQELEENSSEINLLIEYITDELYYSTTMSDKEVDGIILAVKGNELCEDKLEEYNIKEFAEDLRSLYERAEEIEERMRKIDQTIDEVKYGRIEEE